jgi:hypothetical protein
VIDNGSGAADEMQQLARVASVEAAKLLTERFAPYVADPFNPTFANFTDELAFHSAVLTNATLLDFAHLRSDNALWETVRGVVASPMNEASGNLTQQITSRRGTLQTAHALCTVLILLSFLFPVSQRNCEDGGDIQLHKERFVRHPQRSEARRQCRDSE